MQLPLKDLTPTPAPSYVNSSFEALSPTPTNDVHTAQNLLDNSNVFSGSYKRVGWLKTDLKPSFSKMFKTQSELCSYTNSPTICYCHKKSYENTVSLVGRKGQTYFKGTVPCRSPMCITCGHRKAREKAERLENVYRYAAHLGYDGWFPTFTHNRTLSIADSLEYTRSGKKHLTEYLKNIKKKRGIEVAVYWLIEDTFEREPVVIRDSHVTRTHNHLHANLIFITRLSKMEQLEILGGMAKAWRRGVVKAGGWCFSDDRAIKVKEIRWNDDTTQSLGQYMTKLTSTASIDAKRVKAGKMSLEMTHSHKKTSHKGRSLTELLYDIARLGRECDVNAYRHYINANKGVHRSSWNKLWKQLESSGEVWWESEQERIATEQLERIQHPDISIEAKIKKIDDDSHSFMTTGDLPQEGDVKVTLTGVMFDYIVRSGGFYHLKELVSKASIGVHTALFDEFKAYCVENPYWGDHNLKKTLKRMHLDDMMSRWKDQILA